MSRHSKQKVVVDNTSSVGNITQIVRFGVPTALVLSVLAIAVAIVSGYDLRTLFEGAEQVQPTISTSSDVGGSAQELSEAFAIELMYDEVEALNSRVVFAAPFRQSGLEKYIVLAETTLDDIATHGQPAVIDGAIFAQTDGVWQIVFEEKEVTTLGAFGIAFTESEELVQIGPDKYGVLLRWKGGNQGQFIEQAILITEVQGHLKEVLYIVIGEENLGTCGEGLEECWHYSSELEFVPGENPVYYDLQVATVGSRLVSGTVVPLWETKTYIFAGLEYTLSE